MSIEEKLEMNREQALKKFPFLEKLNQDDVRHVLMSILGLVMTKDDSLIKALTLFS